jgi:hypothetical protein
MPRLTSLNICHFNISALFYSIALTLLDSSYAILGYAMRYASAFAGSQLFSGMNWLVLRQVWESGGLQGLYLPNRLKVVDRLAGGFRSSVARIHT